MSSKIEVSREWLVDMTHNQHKKVAAYMPYIADLLAAPAAARPDVLPCDVRVAPATTIRKGCKVETLMQCIELRRGQPPEFTVLKGSAPPELAELQATITKLTAENERLKDEATSQYAKRVAVVEEIERLKGGQGEAVAADIMHDRAYRNGLMAGFGFGINGNEKGYSVAIARYNTEIHEAKPWQPAPVSVALPSREAMRDLISEVIGGDTYDCTRVWSAWGVGTMSEDDFVPVVEQEERLYELADACLDKVKELNK